MKKLTRRAYQKAVNFINNQARPIDHSRFKVLFEGGVSEQVAEELARFQNMDGGFGQAIEPDFRLPDSSPLATSVGLSIAREAGLPGEHPVVQAALLYLVGTFDHSRQQWPAVPPEVNLYPHAPWWEFDPAAGKSIPETPANPSTHVAALFLHWPDRAPSSFLQPIVDQIIAYTNTAPGLDMESLRGCLELAKVLPAEIRSALLERIIPSVEMLITRDPRRWAEYGPQPLTFAPDPESPLAGLLQEDVQKNLDYLVKIQNEDGSWSPNWSWGDSFPEVWEQAMREWQGSLTVDALKALRAYARFDFES